MLLHLPIVVLATLSPVTVSDTALTFDIVKECRYEGGSAANVEQCLRDEAAALGQLKTEWAQSVGAEKRCCTVTTQIGGFASYVELLTWKWRAALRAPRAPRTDAPQGQGSAGQVHVGPDRVVEDWPSHRAPRVPQVAP
jgi:hypothetical protein